MELFIISAVVTAAVIVVAIVQAEARAPHRTIGERAVFVMVTDHGWVLDEDDPYVVYDKAGRRWIITEDDYPLEERRRKGQSTP